MPTTSETLCAAHELLRAKGVRATWEYPGFINIHIGGNYTIVVGDVNESFGADLVRHEEDGGGTDWDQDATDWEMPFTSTTEAVTASLLDLIPVVKSMPQVAAAIAREQRIADAVRKASDAFWESVATAFPEARAGDFSPEDTYAWDTACERAVRTWVGYNVPATEAK